MFLSEGGNEVWPPLLISPVCWHKEKVHKYLPDWGNSCGSSIIVRIYCSLKLSLRIEGVCVFVCVCESGCVSGWGGVGWGVGSTMCGRLYQPSPQECKPPPPPPLPGEDSFLSLSLSWGSLLDLHPSTHCYPSSCCFPVPSPQPGSQSQLWLAPSAANSAASSALLWPLQNCRCLMKYLSSRLARENNK